MKKICFEGLLIILVFSLSNTVAQTTYACNWTDSSNGRQYSISALTSSTADYSVTAKTITTFFNPCRSVLKQTCGVDKAACQTWTSNGKAALGTTATCVPGALQRPVSGQQGFNIACKSGDGGRQFDVDFVCDSTANPGTFTFIQEDPKLTYNYQWPTKFACPINGPGPSPSGGSKLSGGSILLIILLCLMVVYLAAGIAYKKVKVQATGLELIPNVEFWTSLPGLVKDGVMFVVNKTCRRGGYSQL